MKLTAIVGTSLLILPIFSCPINMIDYHYVRFNLFFSQTFFRSFFYFNFDIPGHLPPGMSLVVSVNDIPGRKMARRKKPSEKLGSDKKICLTQF